jgi:hypothetical protein
MSINLIIIFSLASMIFTSSVVAIVWAFKNGHFSNLEKTSRSIFNSEEPEGVQTDYFPEANKR